MGNLCSSGTERGDKKEENRVPDKPRDGEDEALLAGGEVAVAPDDVQAETKGVRDSGHGFGGILGGAVQAGETALADATRDVKEEGEFTADAVQRCWQEKSQVVDGVQGRAAEVATESDEAVKTAAEDAVKRGLQDVESKVTDAYHSTTGKLEETAGELRENVAADVTNVGNYAKDEADAVEGEAKNFSEKSSAWVADVTASGHSAVDSVQGLAHSGVETQQAEAELASSEVKSAAEETTQGGFFGNIKEGFDQTADQVKSTAESVAADSKQTAESAAADAKQTAESVAADAKQTAESVAADAKQTAESTAADAKQTAENKINEAVESVRLSASDTLSSWSDSVSQKVGEVTGNTRENADSLVQTTSNQESTGEQGRQTGFDSLGLTQAVQVESPREPDPADFGEDLFNINSRALLEQRAEGAKDYFTSAADETRQELSGEAEVLFDSVQETCAAGFGEAVSASGSLPQTFSDDFTEASVTNVSDAPADPPDPFLQENIITGVQETVNDAIQAAVKRAQGEAMANVGFDEEVKSDVAHVQFSQDVGSEGDFLEKAKSLLETHRNSLDGGRSSGLSVSFTEDNVQGSEEQPEQAAGSDESIQEATAREFVESIIEKATSFVSESLAQNEPASDSSSPSDPVVDRGEETLAPKKRGVMFVSPQISDRSSSTLSSPQEISPPPPPQEGDLSALADSSSSSISQGELVETDELLEPPPVPAAFSVSENNNNNNNNIVNNNAEDDDESIQRVAMEVTAKAVQDAIKIVAENGTGLVLTSSDLINNDLGISSPSSPGNEEEEMTTTDSSQVERGSPVSDITDTSAHGSVSESLSSYDPGAVFRQDVIGGTVEPSSSSSGSHTAPHPKPSWTPETSVSKPHDKMADLINFEQVSTTHVETPTPTNATPFDSDPHQPLQEPSGDYNPILSPDVPSSASPLDELPPSPSKPMIVINSPDSAHHTNGSCEDISSPLTEALI